MSTLAHTAVQTAAASDVDRAWVFCHPDPTGATSPDGCWTASSPAAEVLFDGYLFEPEEIGAGLGLEPGAAANPARVALAAYERHPACWLHLLRGHYAVIVHDAISGRLFAARDALGLHPLFFARAGSDLVLSRSLDTLLSHPRIPRALNRVALAEHLVHRWSDPSETYYESVRRVPPGHVLEADRQGARLRRYWDPGGGPDDEIRWLRDDEVEQFDAALERAVARCLARGRTGIFLSGGFDSISIAVVAADAARRTGRATPRALSLGFPDPACNEEFIQRGAAQALGLAQDFIPFDEALGRRGLLPPAAELAATWPSPMMNLWNPAYYALGRRGREHGCEVILTGSGGDEWLGVTPYLSADLMRKGDAAGLARLIGTIQRSFRISRREAWQSALWTFGAKPIAGMLIDRAAPAYWRARRKRKIVGGTPAWLAPDPGLRARIDDRADRVLASPQPYRGSFYEQEMRTAIAHPLMSVEPEEYFEFGRRLGARVMHPYWDADLVDLLYRTPPHLLTKGGRSKGLVRESVARRFPNLGFERQRKVHATDFYWKTMQAEGPAAWTKLGKASALADLGVVDAARLADTLSELFAGRRPRESYRIWNTLHLEAWVRSHR